MQKAVIQDTSCDNFSYLGHVFFKKRDRDEAQTSSPLINTLKKLKAFKTQSAAPIQINETATQNIQNQMVNQQLLFAHSDENQKEVVIQSLQEDILNIHHYLPQEIIEKTKNQVQSGDEIDKEQNEMDLGASDLCLAQMKFYCQTCQKQYKNKKTYNSHVQTKHNETKPFLCSLCQKSFKRPDYLQKHKESHKESKEFPCNECDKKFKSRYTHEKHTKTVHAKIICGTCQCCNRGFTRIDYLKKHLQRGQQNYICAYQGCDKKFASKQSMERHNATMHQGRNIDFQFSYILVSQLFVQQRFMFSLKSLINFQKCTILFKVKRNV